VGMPNAGKSTLLSVCSAARPKIANYPFTTLVPQLGIVAVGQGTFTMADIPGLIEGASEGKGLGHQFLRHIERTRAIVHLIDLDAGDVEELATNYRTIRRELERFSPNLAGKQEIVVGNKIDVPEARARAEELGKAIGAQVFALSAVTKESLPELLRRLFEMIRQVQVEQTD
ncbi:MAG: 50S ribosome-binding GTPase, partial [Planctomycetes bacterium]|nr:50S ribosome-binding GTPase [Planctomycetota bacterium]